jgi:hypothetical protein
MGSTTVANIIRVKESRLVRHTMKHTNCKTNIHSNCKIMCTNNKVKYYSVMNDGEEGKNEEYRTLYNPKHNMA